MAHSFITLKMIARYALPRLIENLVMPNLCYRDLSSTFEAKLGDTIQVRKPVVLEAKDFDQSTGVTYQDINEDSVPVTLNKIATVDVDLTALQGALNINDWNRQFIEPATVALAEKINREGMELFPYTASTVGIPGTTPNSLTDIAAARLALNKQKAPMTPRNAVWSPEADAQFTTIPSIVNAEKSGSVEALRNGSIGRIYGFDNYMSQAVASLSNAEGITAAEGVKVTTTSAANAVVGLTGTTLTGSLKEGDIINIGGTNYYVLNVTNVTAASNAMTGLKVAPFLPIDGSDTPVHPEFAANTPVTITSGEYQANMAFHPQCFAFVTRPLVAPKGVESYVTSYNGLSLRVVRGYDMKYKKETISMDILYNYAPLYPELGTTIIGSMSAN